MREASTVSSDTILEGVRYLPVGDLVAFDGNPRSGDVERITESVRRNGQYRPIVVNQGTLTGRPLEVLVGNHTLQACRAAGLESIACTIVDVDDDQAKRIVIGDNRTAQLGTYDEDALHELLGDLPELDGTGYDQAKAKPRQTRSLDPNLLTVGDIKLTLEPDEADLLERAINHHVEQVGVLAGLVRWLIEGGTADADA